MICEKHPYCAFPVGYLGDCPVCDRLKEERLPTSQEDYFRELALAYGRGHAAGHGSRNEEVTHLHHEARRWIRIMGDKITQTREFAEGIIAYEEEHSAGSDTPTRLALAHDLLAILDEP